MFNFIKNNNDTKDIEAKEIEYDVNQVSLEFKKAELELKNLRKLLKDTQISVNIEINDLHKKVNYYKDELYKFEEIYYEKILGYSKCSLENIEFESNIKTIHNTRSDLVKQNAVFKYGDYLNTSRDINFEKVILRGLNKEFETIKNRVLITTSNKHIELFNLMLSFYTNICEERYFEISEKFIETYINEIHVYEHYAEMKRKELINKNLRLKDNKKRKEIVSIRNKFEKDMKKSLEKKKSYFEKLLTEMDKTKKDIIQEKLIRIENHISYLKEKDKYIKYQEEKVKSGYIYFLSNVKSFGKDVFKICATNTLFPFNEIRKSNKFDVPYEYELIYLNLFDDINKIFKEIRKIFKSNIIREINHNNIFFRFSKQDIDNLICRLNSK